MLIVTILELNYFMIPNDGVKIYRKLKRAKESDNMSCKESIYEYFTSMLITETIKTKWN